MLGLYGSCCSCSVYSFGGFDDGLVNGTWCYLFGGCSANRLCKDSGVFLCNGAYGATGHGWTHMLTKWSSFSGSVYASCVGVKLLPATLFLC